MASKAAWTPQAQADVEDILYYIRVEAGRPLTARSIGEEFLAAADAIVGSGFAGLHHPATPAEWRYVRHKRWLMFFKQRGEGIEMLRVVDGVRDLPRVLGGEG
jgi:plasmid stabilization system protein ParE